MRGLWLCDEQRVFITCAVCGSLIQHQNPPVPITPEQIANDAIEAAKAGAAIAHCHVRDPETGAPSRDLALYREVVERIRSLTRCCYQPHSRYGR